MSLALPSADRRQRVTRALGNPAYFGELYVRPFDANWVGPLPRFAREMLAFAVKNRRGVVILPPEYLKTTVLSQVLPLWLTYRARALGLLLRGMLFSEEEGMAVNNLSVVAWHIEHNEYLAADFCDEKGRPLVYPDPQEKTWREDAIVTVRKGAYKDPTWQAKGLNSSGIQGRRIDWLIGDDVITPANAFSPAKREKALRDWDMQITTRLVKKGVAIVAGNFNDPHDLVSTLASRKSYAVFKRPASHAPGEPAVAMDPDNPNAKVLWPENWPLERLRAEKHEKPNRFQRIFMLNATHEAGEKLLVHWVQRIRPEQTPLAEATFLMALDGAPGADVDDDPDFVNISVGALHDGGLDLVESFDFRAGTPQQVELIGLFHDRWERMGQGVLAIAGAKVAMDRYMRGAITIARPDLDAKLTPVSTPGNKNERLEALGPYAKTRWLRVWDTVWSEQTSDPQDRYQEMTLEEQWKEFPNGRHDDKLDGLDLLIRAAREFSGVRHVEFDLTVLEA